jgi:hypothetical protein
MADTGSGLINGVFQVTEAGKRQKLTSISQLTGGSNAAVKTVTIQALSTNTSKICVGGETVVAAVGTQEEPKTSGILLNVGDTISLDIADTAYIWLDAITSKDGVSYAILLA